MIGPTPFPCRVGATSRRCVSEIIPQVMCLVPPQHHALSGPESPAVRLLSPWPNAHCHARPILRHAPTPIRQHADEHQHHHEPTPGAVDDPVMRLPAMSALPWPAPPWRRLDRRRGGAGLASG